MSRTNNTIEERFWDKVDKSGDCWIWLAYTYNGYGRFKVDGKDQWAHRVAWFLEHGYYPEPPMQINHKCNNPPCVRPSHLYEGDQGQSVHDSKILGTFNPGFKKGHKINAKLTWKEVNEMREEFTGAWGEKARLAKKYGVDQKQISRILNGESW